MTEREVAWQLEGCFRANGAEALAFDTIVLVGAARRHAARPAIRRAASSPGNVLLIDFGLQVDGYRSDMTRTVFFGEPDAETRSPLPDAVREAQQAAIEALAVGGDRAASIAPARRPHRSAGVEPFGARARPWHRAGDPRAASLRSDPDDGTLEAGMVFSVEPGIYLPGEIGIRIEDIVRWSHAGPRRLRLAARGARHRLRASARRHEAQPDGYPVARTHRPIG